MPKNYLAKVNESSEFMISESEVDTADIISTGTGKFHIIKDHISLEATIVNSDFQNKSYKVKVENNTYNVNISNDLDMLIKKMGFEVGTAKKINDVKAPMPGLILDIQVEIGQEVKENEALLILEAMKMENVLTSPREGTIKSISASKGDAVDKNQLLITFE